MILSLSLLIFLDGGVTSSELGLLGCLVVALVMCVLPVLAYKLSVLIEVRLESFLL